ncbi:nicotinate-nucleotide adenylyltransferase [Mycoplasmopsis meleagridis]|uniref:nicotinate-nucleotide adenylyltransferase n=1 Tax=Mycoplasmopsis meleagridis TaxID=29561 RepID=UPI00073D9C98|nr:nicotinate-nucleotide adenylyltransferase [Mycoplasmopsis meleagridis]KUH47375.1 nicotinate-nucleotide adenylyltransferase [Mycoplasmopsis meleagridis]
MKIGLYGGSFNPVHSGHIKIANLAINELNLDKLIFIPAAVNPFKKKQKNAPSHDRINMLNLAIENSKKMEISDFEIKRGGISYTFETIRYFKNKFKDHELFFIMGSDLLAKLHKWENIDEIAKKCQLVVFRRQKRIPTSNIKKFNIKVLKNEIFSESSTSIRNGFLEQTPWKVNEYIGKNYLYAFELVHNILKVDPKRAKHCVKAAEFASKLAKNLNYNVKVAYHAGLFHDIAKRFSEEFSYNLIKKYTKNFSKEKYPKEFLHQVCGALWVEKIYKNDNKELIHAISIHTSLDLELNLLDKIIFVADKICDGRAFEGVQKLRKLALENFDLAFKEIVKLNYKFNLDKGVKFDKKALEIYNKWMN